MSNSIVKAARLWPPSVLLTSYIYYVSHQSNIQQCAPSLFLYQKVHSACCKLSRDQQTLLLTRKKTSCIGIWELRYWDHVNYTNKAFFSRQIAFTSKFENTHPHLEDMPSRFLSDLFGHICGQYCLACSQLLYLRLQEEYSGPSTDVIQTSPNTCGHCEWIQTCTISTFRHLNPEEYMQFACNRAYSTLSKGLSNSICHSVILLLTSVNTHWWNSQLLTSDPKF